MVSRNSSSGYLLVDVDEAALLGEELQEDHCTSLAADQAALRVGPGCQPDDLPVTEANLLSHDAADLVLLQRDTRGGLVVVPGLPDGSELLALTKPFLDELGEVQLPQLLLTPLGNLLPQQLGLLPHLRDKARDGSWRQPVVLGDVALTLAVDYDALDDPELLV